MSSFSVRCLFRWLNEPTAGPHTYEERITLWSAQDIDASIALAEAEAQSYAGESNCEYLDFCQAYALHTDVSATAVEVFSLLRESRLAPARYIDTFFASGTERERDA
jgi:hypothetical protein